MSPRGGRRTRTIGDRSELIAHFDQSVVGYQEAHGGARRLFDYRLGPVRRRCEGRDRGALLEVGCGTAVHLTALAPAISRVIETDIYSRDDPCRMAACASPHRHRIELRVDPAEELRTVDDDLLALHVEAIEHMLDQASVVRQVAGPSTHGGIHCTDTERELLVVHTPGLYLGISTDHLTTDSFLTRSNCSTTVRQPAPSITVTGPSFPKAICSVGRAQCWKP